MSESPVMISGPFVLGEILRRNKERAQAERVARQLGIIFRRRKKSRASQPRSAASSGIGPNDATGN